MGAKANGDLLRAAAHLADVLDSIDQKHYIVADYNSIYISTEPNLDAGEKILVWEN